MSPVDPQTPATRGATREEMPTCEQPAHENARRSVVARHDVAAGTVFRIEDVDFGHPGTGLPPGEVDCVVGRRLLRSLERDAPVRPEDVE